MTAAISIQHLSLSYQGECLFEEINLTVPANRWAALLGESGIGKSSLLRMIAGLIKQKEHVISHNHPDEFAYMGQSDLLLPWANVLDNVLLGYRLRSTAHSIYQSKYNEANDLLADVGLAKASHLYPHQLSGGMRQRVALVRTLLENKPIVLMDEPFSALDAITRYKLQTLAVNLLREKTVLFITHDPLEALRLGHDIYIMHGKPAKLHCFANLTSQTPRDFADLDVRNWQDSLFQTLSAWIGKNT